MTIQTLAESNEAIDLELRVLRLLSSSDGLVGAGTLQQELRKSGILYGEATIGRLLRKFDTKGYTKKQGKLGRTLTEKGLTQLVTLNHNIEKFRSGQELVSAIGLTDPEILLEVLVGRRAIEGETARLAAERADDNDLEKLRNVHKAQQEAKNQGLLAVRENQDFHRLIAHIARNRVLEATLNLILKEFEVSSVLIQVRERVGAQFGIEHPEILTAITAHDPDAAQKAMVLHINHLIDDVGRYSSLPPETRIEFVGAV